MIGLGLGLGWRFGLGSGLRLGLKSESESGLGLELGCVKYIKLLIQYIKLSIQYTIKWYAIWNPPLSPEVSNIDVPYTPLISPRGYKKRGGIYKLLPRPDFSHHLLTQVSNTRWQVIAVAAFTCYYLIEKNHQSQRHDLRTRDLSRSWVLTWWCENFIALVFYDCKILCFVIESGRTTWYWISLWRGSTAIQAVVLISYFMLSGKSSADALKKR